MSVTTILNLSWSMSAFHFSSSLIWSMAHTCGEVDCPWSMNAPVTAERALPYALTSHARRGLEVPYVLAGGTPVRAELLCAWGGNIPSGVVSQGVLATLGGRAVELASVELSASQDSYCLAGVVELAHVADWSRAETGMELLLQVGGDKVRLLVDDKSRTQEFGSDSLELDCRSPTSRLDEPYAAVITGSWENVSARAIVQELCDASGVGLVWEICDWTVRLFSVERTPPIDAIQAVITEAAVALSACDGSLVVRYRHPVSPGVYGATPPELIIDDSEHILRLWQETDFRPGYNAVDILSDTSDSGEGIWLEDWSALPTGEDLQLADWQRMVAVFSHPWSAPSVVATTPDAALFPQGEHVLEYEETIEIVEGRGSVSYPAQELLETEYPGANLGSVVCSGKNVTTAIAGYSMLRLRYSARYKRFLVESGLGEKVQLVATAGDAAAAASGRDSLLARVVRAPGDVTAPELIMDPLCTDITIARQRGRNFLDEQGYDKLCYEARTPILPLVLPGAVASVGLTGFSEHFRAKVTGWSLTAAQGRLPHVAWDLERSRAKNWE